jgi:cell division protein YceG involved in septum cleavage
VVLEVGSVVLFWVLVVVVVVVVVVVAVVAVAEVAAAATRSQEGHMVRVVAGSCM